MEAESTTAATSDDVELAREDELVDDLDRLLFSGAHSLDEAEPATHGIAAALGLVVAFGRRLGVHELDLEGFVVGDGKALEHGDLDRIGDRGRELDVDRVRDG